MIKKCFLAILVILGGISTASAQSDSLGFVEFPVDETINEGDFFQDFIIAVDSAFTDSIFMWMDPPPETFLNITVNFEQFSDSENVTGYRFAFAPNYDLLASGQISYPITFYATNFDTINPPDTISTAATITVLDNNPKPIIESVPNERILEGLSYQTEIVSYDLDGSIPGISYIPDPLPVGADYVPDPVDSGRGLFTFTAPDLISPDTAADYQFTFYAQDAAGDSSVSETFTITVFGPNVSPAFVITSIEDKNVTEGQLLVIDIIAIDENGTHPRIWAENLPDTTATFTYDAALRPDTGRFEWRPNYIQGGDIFTVNFYAYDSVATAMADIDLQVIDAGNQQPIFLDTIEFFGSPEGESFEFLIATADPDTNHLKLQWSNLPENANFDTTLYERDSGLFTFSPWWNQGGMYDVLFIANDDSLLDSLYAETLLVSFEIVEVDTPPQLYLDPSNDQIISEGEQLRISWVGSDDKTPEPLVTISPPPDSNVFKGNMAFVNNVQGGVNSGYLEFTPDFNHVQDGASQNYNMSFTMTDLYDTAQTQFLLTVTNVIPDTLVDPGLPDTLTALKAVWDPSFPGFVFRTRIWNDSAIAAAMTGFRWYEPWLTCDSVRFDPVIFDTAIYDNTHLFLSDYIFNDSMMFSATFLFFDSLYLDGGLNNHLTAYFSFDPADTTVDTTSAVYFDTASVGSGGGFFFDKRLRDPMKSAADIGKEIQQFGLNEYTYKPLINMGFVRSAVDSISVNIYNAETGLKMARGDIMQARNDQDELIPYELRFNIENAAQMRSMNLGFSLNADSTTWVYGAPSFIVNSFSRTWPDIDIWNVSQGLTLTPTDMDGQGTDYFIINGESAITPEGGLAPGQMEYVASIPFTLATIPENGDILCIDSIQLALGEWLFTYQDGTPTVPGFSGKVCIPVGQIPITEADDTDPAIARTYHLSQNYPNPFNPITTIEFSLARREHVRLTVYNILGQEVIVLADQSFEPGDHTVIWDGRNGAGRAAATGIYLYHIKSEGFTDTKKMLLLK